MENIRKNPYTGEIVDPFNDPHEVRATQVYLDEYGREMPDPTPLYVALGITPNTETIEQVIQRYIQAAARVHERVYETAEDADDFEVDEGGSIRTAYTVGDFWTPRPPPPPAAPADPAPPAPGEAAGGQPPKP